MAEYIDRDAAIAACFDGFADCRDDCAANIRSIPAADVVERKTGKWKGGGKSAFFPEQEIYCCSECDRHYFNNFRFCPHCGAQMIGGDEDGA